MLRHRFPHPTVAASGKVDLDGRVCDIDTGAIHRHDVAPGQPVPFEDSRGLKHKVKA